MAIGRITGSVLKSNLTRNGVDLAFETNLLYLDVTNSRIGIGTSEPSTALHVSGTITATAISGLTSLAVDTVTIADNTITTNASNADLVLDPSGTGRVVIKNELVTNSISSDDSTAIQINDGVNISGVLSANTIDTNVISSSDSSAIQVQDSINLGSNTITANTGAFANFTLSDTLTIGSQIIYAQGTNGFSVNEDFDPSNSSTQTAYHYTTGAGRETLAFTLARTGQFTDGFGIYGTSANNTFVTFGEQSNTSFEWRRGVGIRPLDLDGGTLMMRLSSAGDLTINNDITVQGSVFADNIQSTGSNANIVLDPQGSGKVILSGLSFPSSDGTTGQVMVTDGSGNLSFTTISTSSISAGNSSVNVSDTGVGSVTVSADGSTIITMTAATVLDASATTNAIRLPVGTTGERPSGSIGMIRYNSTTDTIEGYTSAGGWAQLGATSTTAENTADTATGNETAISTTAKVINQFTTGSFDSAWYLAVTRDEINDEVSTAKYSMVHDGSSAFVGSSHITESNPANDYITVDADVTGGNVRLKATGGSVVNSVSFYRIGLGDNTSAGTTGAVTTVINADVDSASEVIDSWAHASYRGAKYYISVNNTAKTELTNIEALVVHDGTTAYITSYGSVNTGNNTLINLTAAINGSNVEVSASGNEPNLRVTIYRIILTDSESGSTGDNVNLVAAATVSSSATAVDTFNTQTYTGAFYVAVGYNSTEGAASISEVMMVANDDAYVSTGPILSTKGTDQLIFTAGLSGTTATLYAASTSGASTVVNAYRVHMLRGSAGAATADTVLVSTEQTITGAKTFTAPIALAVGSDPSTVADKAHIYAKDEAASAEVFVRDEAGNVTKISPHNAQGEWEYYSRNVKTGKTVRINMEEMIRDLEKLTGKNYIKNE
jgi:hypothetical protein